MKTTELIPIILYQLVDGDKYGYEIVKQIEDSSNGGIVIKQPTLYSVLKKLEQGRFISSYWQDSEIGGKRHYYKLTDNGKAQLDTYPPFEDLIKEALQSEGVVFNSTNTFTSKDKEEVSSTLNQEIKDTNLIEPVFDTPSVKKEDEPIVDNISVEVEELEIKPTPIDLTSPIDSSVNRFDEVDIKPIDLNIGSTTSVLDSNLEIDSDKNDNSQSYINIFDAMEYDGIDLTNNSAIEDENVVTPTDLQQQNIIETDKTPKFTEKVDSIEEPYVVNKLYDKLTPSQDLVNEVKNSSANIDMDTSSPIEPMEEVKYLNYVDFSTDKLAIKRRKTITKHIQKMTVTCITLLLAFICTFVLCNKYSFSKLYYLSAIIVCLILVLYPITLIARVPKIRFKYCSRPFRYSISRDFFIKLSLFLSLVITIFAYNLSIVQTISDIFKMDNFASFGAPIILSFVSILDFVYGVIIYKQYTK